MYNQTINNFTTPETYNKHFEENSFRNLPFEEQYLLSGLNIWNNGNLSSDRTGVGTKFYNSQSIHIDCEKEIPLLKFKFVNPRNALIEMIWMLKGLTNISFLKEHGVNYWDSWADENGELGPVYGSQMRNFEGVDQILGMIERLKTNPDCRRNIVSLWNPLRLKEMALAPCHYDYQIFTNIDETTFKRVMYLHTIQRSADYFLGVPYDFMLFYFFGIIMSIATDYKLKTIDCTFKNYHIYNNHHIAVTQYFNNYTINNNFISKDPIVNHEFDFDKYRKYYLDLGFDGLLDMIVKENFELSNFPEYTKENRYKLIPAPIAV